MQKDFEVVTGEKLGTCASECRRCGLGFQQGSAPWRCACRQRQPIDPSILYEPETGWHAICTGRCEVRLAHDG